MQKWIKRKLARRDSFGTWAKFHYRKESGFGTTFGGFCTLILKISIFLFASVQLFGWRYKPAYIQSTLDLYIPNAESPLDLSRGLHYSIELGDFLPTFVVYTNHTKEDGTSEEYWWTPEDP